jgi:hypothetical protein
VPTMMRLLQVVPPQPCRGHRRSARPKRHSFPASSHIQTGRLWANLNVCVTSTSLLASSASPSEKAARGATNYFVRSVRSELMPNLPGGSIV